jgi:hypothetical protein
MAGGFITGGPVRGSIDLAMQQFNSTTKETGMWSLLLLPFIGLLWVPFYNHELPSLFGFPFFYWYQLAWVPITSLLIWIVYRHGVRKGVE